MSDIYFFYNKDNLKILTTVRPNDTFFDINDFISTRIQYDISYAGLEFDRVGYILGDSVEYDRLINTDLNTTLRVNEEKQIVEIDIFAKTAMTNKNVVYGCQDVKRIFSNEDILNMYNRDYINCNIKNIVKSGVLEVKYTLLKDIKTNPRIAGERWESFFTDPYLKEMGENKLTLGRDIIKRGQFFPFTVSKDKDGIVTIFDGQHRIISLKLLQFYGEIPDDFKVLCIYIHDQDSNYKDGTITRQVEEYVTTRQVFETKYGSEVIIDDFIKTRAMESIIKNGGIFIDDFTIEWQTKSLSEIIFGIHAYPLWIRDLIYPIPEMVKPNPIIYNEEAFLKWKEEE